MNELDTRVREALDRWRVSDERRDWQDVLIRAEAQQQQQQQQQPAASPSRSLLRSHRRLILVVLVATLTIVLVAPASGWVSSAVRDLLFTHTSEESHGPAPGQVEAQSPVSVYGPYQASLAFARCMRERGIPHPNPDRSGNFELTPRDEARMKRVPRARREAADKACFRYLKPVVSTKPLSPTAKAKARAELTKLSRCMARYGYVMTDPIVRDLSRGRLFFGFRTVAPPTIRAQSTARYKNAQRTCERGLAKRLDKIVAADRGEFGH
jgi:hypothetical protein